VDFDDSAAVEASGLQVPIDIGGKGEEGPVVAELLEYRVASMRRCVPVEIQTVPIESPGQLGVPREVHGIGHLLESNSQVLKRGVGLPEPSGSTEVRQA
jgi:hypothetical protein